jgi:hypothetical protein
MRWVRQSCPWQGSAVFYRLAARKASGIETGREIGQSHYLRCFGKGVPGDIRHGLPLQRSLPY